MDKKENHIINIIIQFCGSITVFIGISAIFGWILGVPEFASFASGKIPMALSSAVLFVLLGFIIFFYQLLPASRIMQKIGIALSYFGIFFSILLLYLSLNGILLPIEHLGLKISEGADDFIVGHMSPVTAFSFLFAFFSFLIIQTKLQQKKLIKTSIIFITLVFVISIIFLLSYLLGTPLLYAGSFIPPALTTSLAFLLLSIALLLTSGLKVLSNEEMSNALGTRYTFTLALVFIILFISIMTAGYSYYKSYEKQSRIRIEQELESIATIKVNQIVQWRKERLRDAEVIYKNIEFSKLVKQFFNNQNNLEVKNGIQEWIDQVRSIYEYNRISLIDVKGKELIASPRHKIYSKQSFSLPGYEIRKLNEIIFKDFFRDEKDKRIYLEVLIPIKFQNSLIGILTMRIDPQLFLYPLINEWPLPSKTAETLIIRRDGEEVVYLNELKFQRNTALNFRRLITEKNLTSASAVLGKKGIVQGVDYRGFQVLAYLCEVPNSPWYMVARIDLSEIYAQLKERFWSIIILLALFLIGLSTSIGLIWRNQISKFYLERYQSTEKIRKLNRVYFVLSEINEAIVRIRNPQELFEKACDIVVNKGGFQIAWIGKINSHKKKIIPIAINGISEDQLTKLDFNLSDDDSLLGMQWRDINSPTRIISNHIQIDKSILHLHKDSELNNLKSSAAFPLNVFGQVWGVFKLYSNEVGFFDEEELKLLDELAMDISFSIEFAEKEAERMHAEEKLLSSEVRYRRLFESAKDGILILDAETGKIVDVNPFLIDLLGYTKENLIEKEIWELGFFKDIVANFDKFLELKKNKYVRYENLPLETHDGRKINVEFVSNVYQVNSSKVIQCNIRDITARKLVEQTLIESEEKFRIITENSADAIFVTDNKGRYIYVNSKTIHLLGYTKEEILSLSIADLAPKDKVEGYIQIFSELLKVGRGFSELELIKKDGNLISVDLNAVLLPNGLVYGSCRDITQRKRAEQELLKLSRAVEQSPVSVIITDTKGNIEYINPKVTEITGYELAEVIGKNPRIFTSGEKPKSEYKILWDKITEGKEWRGEFHNKKKNGELYWELASISAIVNEKGETTHYLAVKEDITERKLAEKEITMLAHSLKSINECVSITDMEDKIIFVNEAFLKTYGYSSNELIGKQISIVRSPNNPPELVEKILNNTINGGWYGELWNRRRDGSDFQIYLSTTIINDKTGNHLGLIGVATDITERKQTEAALKKKEYMLSQSQSLAHIGSWGWDLKGPIEWSDETYSIYHVSPHTFIPTFESLISLIHPLDRSLMEKWIQNNIGGKKSHNLEFRIIIPDGSVRIIYGTGDLILDNEGNPHYMAGTVQDITERKLVEEELIKSKDEFRMLAESMPQIVWITRADGRNIYFNQQWVDYTGLSLFDSYGDGWNKPFHPQDQKLAWDAWKEATNTNTVYSIESRLRRADGEYKWFLVRGVPILDADGTIVKWFGTCTDINEIKLTEQELIKAKEKAEQSDKLKTEFLAQMSHEIRSPMNAVMSFASLLRNELNSTLTTECTEYFDGIDSAGRRLIRTVDLILNSSEIQIGTYQPTFDDVDIIGEVIQSILKDYTKLFQEKDLKLIFYSNISECFVNVDRYSINQIFVNLIDNALKYTMQGSFEISAETDEHYSRIKITLKDTGVGMSEDFINNMYEPFTQEDRGYSRRFEGNGLGLSLVKKYCDLNKISISVESNKGVGTKFTLIIKYVKCIYK